jgi:WD40 repeat protein
MDNSIKLISSDGARTLETAHGHCAPVTCLSLSPDSNYLVTGSKDTTVLLWRIHRAFTSHSSKVSEPSTGTGTSTSTSSTTLSNILADKSRKRHIEGPLHVLRGHQREILCCCVSSDLGVVVSCSPSSDVLLHSIRRGRLMRRLAGMVADSVCLSSQGVVMTWNKSQQTLSTFSLNGAPISRAQLPFSGSISCMEISVDGENALIGLNSCLENDSGGLKLKKRGTEDLDLESDGTKKSNRLDIPSPSICFLDLHTLQVWYIEKCLTGN